MAIDSAEKRQNAAKFGRIFMRTQFPIAAPDEQWRAGVVNMYGGNALSPSTAAAVFIPRLTLMGVG